MATAFLVSCKFQHKLHIQQPTLLSIVSIARVPRSPETIEFPAMSRRLAWIGGFLLLLLASGSSFRPTPSTTTRQLERQWHVSSSSSFSSSSISDPQSSTTQNGEYSLQVSYEGRSCKTTIRPGESILAALERTRAADQLAMPDMPFDCRRGNCLTCVGMHEPHSHTGNLVRGENGLSPFMSQQAEKRGYILTCSSTIVGDGVKLRIGANHQAWEELYRGRLEEEESQLTGREAMAKVIRLNAERNVERWADETEEILRKSPDL
jgi:ferredoxin